MSEPTPSRSLVGAAILRDPLVCELLAMRLIGVLATLEPDGSVHAVPMWLAPGDGVILLATGSRSRKVRNLDRDPRATLVLHDSRPGFEVCGTSIQGHIEFVRGADATQLVDRVHRRYVSAGGERLAAAAEFFASDDVALRLTPSVAVLWDERASDAARVLREAGATLPLEPTFSREDG